MDNKTFKPKLQYPLGKFYIQLYRSFKQENGEKGFKNPLKCIDKMWSSEWNGSKKKYSKKEKLLTSNEHESTVLCIADSSDFSVLIYSYEHVQLHIVCYPFYV